MYRIDFITADICFFLDIICHKSTATATLVLVPLSTVELKDQGSIVTDNRGDKNLSFSGRWNSADVAAAKEYGIPLQSSAAGKDGIVNCALTA